MQELENNNELEKRLINQGDILNPRGVLQVLHLYNDELTKDTFCELVKQNYRIANLDDTKIKKIDASWKIARHRIRMMGLLVDTEDENIIRARINDWLYS